MYIVILVFCLFLSIIFHQATYLLLPILLLGQQRIVSDSTIELNDLSKLLLKVVIFTAFIALVQFLFSWSIELYSLKGIARYFCYFAFSVLLLNCDKAKTEYIFKFLSFYFIISLPFFVIQVANESGRYENIFSHANHLAYVLVLCIYFIVYHKLFKGGLKLTVLAALFFSLLLTNSSGAMITLVLLMGYNLFNSSRVRMSRKMLLVLILILVSLVIFYSSDKLQEQVETLNYFNWEFLWERVENYRPGGYGSFIWRIIYWLKILSEFFAEPIWKIIFGVGVDALTEGNMPYAFMNKDPHNDFVKVLVEYGITGFLLLVSFLYGLYRIVRRNFNLIIVICIPMFFGNTIVNIGYIFIFLILVNYEFRYKLGKAV